MKKKEDAFKMMIIFLPFLVVRNKPVKPGNEISWVLVYPSLFSLSHLSSSLPSFYHHHLFSTATGVLQLHHKSRDRNHRLVCSSSLIPTFKVKLHPETLVSSSPSLPHLLHPHPLLGSLHPLGFFRNLVQFSFFTTILIPCYRFP